MYPLTQSFFGVYLSVLIIFGLLFFGKNLPALESYSLYIIIFLAVRGDHNWKILIFLSKTGIINL